MKSFIKRHIKKMIFPKTDSMVVYEGIKLDISSRYISDEMRYQLGRAYETAEIQLLKSFLEPKDKLLEIGTGLGFLAIFAKNKCGVVKYLGIEANEYLLPIIKRNCELNHCTIEIENIAISDREGEIDFRLASNFWSSSIYDRKDDDQIVKLPCTTLNKFIADKNFYPTFLLIDMEGGEEILDYESLPKQIEKLLVELHPHFRGTKKASEVITKIIRAGFSLVDFCQSVYFFKRR